MSRNDFEYVSEYVSDEFDRSENSQDRLDPKFKKRRRPDYCKKRTPTRSGMAQRNNWRRSR